MRIYEMLAGALQSLAVHPLRSLLTVTGVVTGVAAVIVVIAAGEGSRRAILEQMEFLGTETLVVLPGPAGGASKNFKDALSRKDAELLKQQIKGIAVSPEVIGKITVQRRKKALSVSMVGATPSFLKVRNFRLANGRFFTPEEGRGRKRVCVLGARIADKLFPHGSPLGGHVRVNRIRYRVIGVFEAKGDMGWFHPDDWVVMPLSTAQTRVLGISHVHTIAVDCPSLEKMPEVREEIEELLRRRHRLKNRLSKDRLDFHVINQQEMIRTASKVSDTMRILLIGLAAVALVTGGVGIMNIMLVSVTERTAEIGLRKAVGATGGNIFVQFLFESMLLSAAGAALGVATGAAASVLLSGLGEWELVLSLPGILLAVAMALAVGMVFGIYPALRAASLEPVEALRK
ncbi:MAG: ABC transporter permease [bacterium]